MVVFYPSRVPKLGHLLPSRWMVAGTEPHNLRVQRSKQIIPYFNSFVLPILSIVTKYLILKGYSLVIDNKGEGL